MKLEVSRQRVARDLGDGVTAIAEIDIVPTILETVCKATGMGFAAVARVTDEKWIACSVRDNINFGLTTGGELKLNTTICHEIRQSGNPVVIPDVQSDAIYCDHHTPALYGFRSYISIPIVLPDGRFFGTLCAIDPAPHRSIDADAIAMFEMFAQIIGSQIDQNERLAEAESRVSAQEQDAELREQFIAVLGHDLRNPLANIQAGVTLLERGEITDRQKTILDNMRGSVDRMADMIANILDFARGRLGGGLSLRKQPTSIQPLLDQVIIELRNSHTSQNIIFECDASVELTCDQTRIAQLLSNLVGNALTHGAADQPVEVRCSIGSGEFNLSVTNGGDPIPEATLPLLFSPFSRGAVSKDKEGLGLGLYIASEIAKAHGGALSVRSNETATCFSFRMPIS
jgi:signal transduction histidine kinase